MLIKLNALALAAIADIGSDLKAETQCVRIGADATVSATDGHLALVLPANVEAPSLFEGDLDIEKRGQALDMLIPADVVLDFLAACRKRKKTDETAVVVYKNGTAVDLATTDGVTTKKFLATTDADPTKFPAIEKMFDASVTRETLIVSVVVLTKLLRTLKALGATAVEFGIPPGASTDDKRESGSRTRTVTVLSKTDAGEVRGVFAPMVKFAE